MFDYANQAVYGGCISASKKKKSGDLRKMRFGSVANRSKLMSLLVFPPKKIEEEDTRSNLNLRRTCCCQRPLDCNKECCIIAASETKNSSTRPVWPISIKSTAVRSQAVTSLVKLDEAIRATIFLFSFSSPSSSPFQFFYFCSLQFYIVKFHPMK